DVCSSDLELQVEAVQLDGDPRVAHRGTDGLVMWQRPGRSVDEEQFQLGAGSGRAGAESGPFQQLPERGQAFLKPLGEALVIAVAELFLVDVGSHDRAAPSRRGTTA